MNSYINFALIYYLLNLIVLYIQCLANFAVFFVTYIYNYVYARVYVYSFTKVIACTKVFGAFF